MNNSIELLRTYKLRITQIRLNILDIFRDNKWALSEKDIEEFLKEKYDRVTIYRTLHTFCKKSILHKVIDNTSLIKYALCQRECFKEKYCHNHLHFKCEICSNTCCFKDFSIDPTHLYRKGYNFKEINILAVGVCDNCNPQRGRKSSGSKMRAS